MVLTEQARKIADAAAASFPALGTTVLDAAEARRILAARPAPAEEPVGVGQVTDRDIPGPDGERLPVRIYRPDSGRTALPVVVFYHGGGFVICDLDSHDQFCRTTANETGMLVVAVDYRRAPEHRFPAAVEDADTALRWVAAHAAEIGADSDRIAVAGDSAGGNLAATVSLRATQRGSPHITTQVLLYPMLDPAQDTQSYRDNAEGYFVTADHLRWYWEQYLGPAGSDGQRYVSPLHYDTLVGAPPAHVVTAEHDPLRDEGDAYAERLRTAGVAARLERYDGMFHGFATLLGQLPEADDAATSVFTTLRTATANTPAR